jgi:hypothetical protein
LPERDAAGLDRFLAASERELRFAQKTLDAARLVRNCLVVFATYLGRSRREVGETLGLSLGRVQQLSEDPSREVTEVVQELVEAATLVAKNMGEGPCPREEIPKPHTASRADHESLIDLMLLLGLLEERSGGLQLTADGKALSGGPAAGKGRKSGQKRERAIDAPK